MKTIRKRILMFALAFVISLTSAGVCLAASADTFAAASSETDAVTIAKPVISSVKNTTSGVKVVWKKNAKVTGYLVYRKEGSGSYSKIKKITSASTVSYVDKKIWAGKTYTYKIVAYKTVSGKNYKSKPSAVKSIKYVYPGKDALAAYKKVAGKQLEYHFAAGYYGIAISANGRFKLSGGTQGATHWSRISGNGQFIKAKKVAAGVFQVELTNVIGTMKSGWQDADGTEKTEKKNLSSYNGKKGILILKGSAVPSSYQSDLSRYISGGKATTDIFWIKDLYSIFIEM